MYQQPQHYYYMNTDVKTPFKIIFEDNHLLAVIKPFGVVSEHDEYHEVALDTMMKDYIKVRDKKPGNVFLTPIHRLDKPASGIVIFAKTSKALERMHVLMQKREISKTYTACLDAAPEKYKDTLVHHLVQKMHKAELASPEYGKKAELSYKVTLKDRYGVWVDIDLVTGRYHQIRAQFAAIGCPILGDKRYGAKTKLPHDAIALIHTKTSFLHPVTKALVELSHPDVESPSTVFLDKLLGQV